MDNPLESAAAPNPGISSQEHLKDGGTRSPDGDCVASVVPEASKEPQDWGVLTGWRMIAAEVMNDTGEAAVDTGGAGWTGAGSGAGEQQWQCGPSPEDSFEMAGNRIQSVVAKSGWGKECASAVGRSARNACAMMRCLFVWIHCIVWCNLFRDDRG